MKVRFAGYVKDLSEEVRRSRVLLSPRLAGLGLSTKVMLGLESGLPTVTTTHGTTGYNITRTDGTQGIFTGDAHAAFAEEVIKLLTDDALWVAAARGGLEHAWGMFGPERQRDDVKILMDAAAQYRRRTLAT